MIWEGEETYQNDLKLTHALIYSVPVPFQLLTFPLQNTIKLTQLFVLQQVVWTLTDFLMAEENCKQFTNWR